MPVAIACLEQEDLGFGVLCWEGKVIRAEKIADGRVPLPARSGYISENRGTVLEKSRRGRVVVVVVFFTLTDRASTIPSNTRGCQSGTWSTGQKRSEEHLPSSNESIRKTHTKTKTKQKTTKRKEQE